MDLNHSGLRESGTIFRQDMELITNDKNIPFAALEGKTVLVTGATGLIGYNLVSALLFYNQATETPIRIITLIRNLEKLKALFGEEVGKLNVIVSDICDVFDVAEDIDYIVHGASITSSREFVTHPVNTALTAIDGTRNMLELAKRKRVKGFLYLSSMEVYGSPDTDEMITEEHGTNLDTMSVRSSYPESKRMCETICTAYGEQFGIPVFVLRLTQTFGLGVKYEDERVFAQFARSAVEEKNIVLHTRGETKRNYLYTADAVRAMLMVLLKGESLNAYNAANEASYCSVYDMACLVVKTCASKEIQVERECSAGSEQFGYAPQLKMNLCTKKLQGLGWEPYISLEEMYKRMIQSIQEQKRKREEEGI